MIGQTVSHYRILDKLGAGGMGEVYLADDTKLDRRVALKFLPEALHRDSDARERLLREARAASRLRHPNIVTIHSIEQESGRDFIVMEHVDGVPLSEFVRRSKPGVATLERIFQDLCRALDHAHAAGIVHRDLKPDNILIEADGRVRILDFGVARQRGTPRLTQTGSVVGTVAYVSPEQISGGEASPSSDLFSLGVVLYELLAGHRPFAGEHEAAILYAIAHEEPPPLDAANPEVTPHLQSVVMRCLAKRPADRFPSAGAAADALLTPYQPVAVPAKVPSIAVLPFVNRSSDPENEYFGDGLAEELINALSKIRELRVVARSSAFSFKGKTSDAREIGRVLDVETLLEGSVRRSGNTLRVTAQLVQCRDGYDLWSERFDRELDDVFEIQDEITRVIVDQLRVKLLEPTGAVIARRQTENAEALALFMKGRFYWNKRDAANLRRSIECFEQALALDPEYTQAMVGLADAYNVCGFYHVLPPRITFGKARQYAERALALEPESARALASVAYVHYYLDWKWADAEAEWKRAQTLEPGYPFTYLYLANLLTAAGRLEEGFAALQRAYQLDRLSLIVHTATGWNRYFARDYAAAETWLKDALKLDSTFVSARIWLGKTYDALGRFVEAQEQFRAVSEDSGSSDWAQLGLARTLARCGQMHEAESIASRLELRAREAYVPALDLALLHLALGDENRALSTLERALDDRCSDLVLLNMDPRWDGMRARPRFKSVVTTVGIPGS